MKLEQWPPAWLGWKEEPKKADTETTSLATHSAQPISLATYKANPERYTVVHMNEMNRVVYVTCKTPFYETP